MYFTSLLSHKLPKTILLGDALTQFCSLQLSPGELDLELNYQSVTLTTKSILTMLGNGWFTFNADTVKNTVAYRKPLLCGFPLSLLQMTDAGTGRRGDAGIDL